jgi:predicted nucleotidyltransferase component of viral defense system
MKTSTQLKALTRNLAKKNIEAQIILRNYMLERLLERISVSKYKDNFILKGGMLIAAMVGMDTRSTMDMDTTLKGQAH